MAHRRLERVRGGRQRIERRASSAAGKEHRRSRLLQRDVDAEHGRVRSPDETQHHAPRIDDGDRHLGGIAEGLPDLRAGAVGDFHRAPEDLGDLRLGQEAVGTGFRRVPVDVVPIDQHVGVEAGEGGIGIGAYARRRRAIGNARENGGAGVVAVDREERPHGAVDCRKSGRGRRIADRACVVGEAQRTAIGRDVIGPAVGRGFEAATAGDRDLLVDVGVVVEDVEVERIKARGHHTDTADHGSVLVQRQPARLGGKPERRGLRPDGSVARVADEIGAGELAVLNPEQRSARLLVFLRVEVILNDLAGGARREAVPRRGQVGAGDGHGNGAQSRVEDRVAFEPALYTRLRGNPERCRTVHPEHAEDIADTIDHRNGRLRILRLRLGHGLGDDLLHIGDGQQHGLGWRRA